MNKLLLALALPAALALSEESQWAHFKAKYGKSYNSTETEAHRFGIFKDNLLVAARLNAKRVHVDDAEFGVTQFMDLSKDEFAAQYLNYQPPAQRKANDVYKLSSNADPPADLDW